LVKSAAELAKMRKAGQVVAEMHAKIREAIRPGVTTAALDKIGREVIERRGARSNFLGYGRPPFPGVICASPNDVIVHGIPGPFQLDEGDIISIDCGAIIDGWHGDAAFTAPVGEVTPEALALIEATEASLAAAIDAMRVGGRLSDIGAAVQSTAERAGFSVVREYTGHGIGLAMHEAPDVPNWGKPGKGRRLAAGQTYAVEPMVCAGRADTMLLDDDWTVVTADGGLAAHAEHTIAITDNGPEILTR
jgi:methionyl aminopeptidase